MLLNRFEEKILPTDVLYVNLEPCCHRGKTPPCTGMIHERGVRRVVYGMGDPDPRVSGAGISFLRNVGVDVRGPVERARCEWLNRGFISLKTKGRPWVTLKRAQTRNGKVMGEGGRPLKITSIEQDRWAHQWLRARHDAILVGVQTIVTDDPRLNTRFAQEGVSGYPLRIVLDPQLRVPLTATVVSGALAGGTMLIVAGMHDPTKERELTGKGVRIFRVPLLSGEFDFHELWKTLTSPCEGFLGVARVLVEGGKKTWDSFQRTGANDEEIILLQDAWSASPLPSPCSSATGSFHGRTSTVPNISGWRAHE
jgi:diaminohydroxyphosphoribosylaminopyrimidine deaminase/5-amino-6-(5-phosphoribosylamino)uracil reductase